jgi:hypothetical protein
MKALKYLIAFILCLGMTGIASADPIDFQMNVLDPSPGPNAVVIRTLPFSVSFSPCGSFSNLPSGLVADGCFEGFNDSGLTWDNLLITFANNPALASQPPGCGNLDAPDSVFTITSCTLTPDNSTYILSFMDGIIVPSETFFIAETSPTPPAAFGVGTTTVLTATPEPGTFVLLASGMAALGLLLYADRARASRALIRN